jgi:PAS domain S-box-containing protein
MRAGDERYRTLFGAIDQGFCIVEVMFDEDETPIDYRFLETNPSFDSQTGMVDAQGKRMRELVPNHEEYWFEIYGRVALTGQPIRFVNRAEHLHRWYDVYAFRSGQPENRHVAILFSDITERHRAEEALRQSEERHRLMFESAPIAVNITRGTDITYANPSYLRMFRFSSLDELKSYEPIELFAPEWRSKVRDNIQRRAEGLSVPDCYEAECLRKDGTRFPILMYLTRTAFTDGPATVAFVLDITSLKQAEAEKARLEDQLRQAQSMESLGRLAGGVAHEFNNSLTVILGNVDFALEQLGPAHPLHADLTDIRKAASRSANVVRHLLAFASRQMVRPRVLDLNEPVASMLKIIEGLIGQDTQLRWKPGADLWPVEVDPSQIEQILTSVCLNARDALPGGGAGAITIETGNITVDHADCADLSTLAPGDYVTLVVSDDGRGMDRETLAHIFEPFFTTKRVGEGPGLGLATVYGAVKQNDGSITVRSAPDAGTTFTIYLPRHVGRTEQSQGDRAAGA